MNVAPHNHGLDIGEAPTALDGGRQHVSSCVVARAWLHTEAVPAPRQRLGACLWRRPPCGHGKLAFDVVSVVPR